MSYYNNQQQGGYPPQGQAPPPGQGYGAPPPNQFSPQSSPQYPPQQQGWSNPTSPQGYPQQYPPQQPYGQPPPNQYAPPPQQPPYGAPPPGQYSQQPYSPQPGYSPQQPGYSPQQQGFPPQQQGYPPAQQYGAPPPGQYGAPPPGQYGAPPPGQPPYGAPPQHGHYGAPAVQPTPPSPGYGPPPNVKINVTAQIETIYKAMKGFGTNEKVLIAQLCKQDPIQMNAIRKQYEERYHQDLIKHLEKETSGEFEEALVALARGPLLGDVYTLKQAVKGLGTKEAMIDDVLIGRSNADMRAIKDEYQKVFKTSLESDLRSDLSAATEQMFVMIIAARRNEAADPVNPQQIDRDVDDLQSAFGNFMTKNSVKACEILTSRNDAQIRAIADRYSQKYGQPFDKTLKNTFDGHMEDALLLLLARAKNRAASDAERIEDAMAGIGTKDTLLIQRVIRAHWDRAHMQRVSVEYQNKYRKDLVKRIKGETRGDYEKLLVAIVE